MPAGVQRTVVLALLTALAAGLLWVEAPAAANGGGDRVVLIIEDQGCQGNAAACFLFETGGPANFTAGGHGVQLVVENRASDPHDLHVAALEDADPSRNTSTDRAFLSIEPLEPGDNTTRSFHPASHFEGIYIFSNQGGAEAQGLWYELPYEGEARSGAQAQAGSEEPSPAPGPGTVASLVAIWLVAAGASRRHR